ncbi:MAG TPA: hypothetical protein VKT28_07245 [Puia sp.]|nr:hypothetical protein [Puia sp.]
MENKTKIIITRKSERLNRLRSIKILIDGIEAGSIKKWFIGGIYCCSGCT